MIIWSAAQLLSEQRENRWTTYISADRRRTVPYVQVHHLTTSLKIVFSSAQTVQKALNPIQSLQTPHQGRLLAFSKHSTNTPILRAVRPHLPAFQQSRSAVSQILLGQTDLFAKAFSTASDSALWNAKPTSHLPYNSLLCCWMPISRLPKKKIFCLGFLRVFAYSRETESCTQCRQMGFYSSSSMLHLPSPALPAGREPPFHPNLCLERDA